MEQYQEMARMNSRQTEFTTAATHYALVQEAKKTRTKKFELRRQLGLALIKLGQHLSSPVGAKLGS